MPSEPAGYTVIPAKAGTQEAIGRHYLMKKPCVYILASKRNGTLYTGVTSELKDRVYKHKTNAYDGFTRQYGIHILVWFEEYERMEDAIVREKQIKKWRRQWKLELIEGMNPTWRDLYDELH